MQNSTGKIWGSNGNVLYLVVMVVTWMCTFGKTHKTIHFKWLSLLYVTYTLVKYNLLSVKIKLSPNPPIQLNFEFLPLYTDVQTFSTIGIIKHKNF